MQKKAISIYLLSDSTGETVQSLCRAVMAQFDTVDANLHVWMLVKESRQLNQVLETIKDPQNSIVMYTLVDQPLIDDLEGKCAEQKICCISILGPILSIIQQHFNVEMTPKPGHQHHHMSQEYFDRIAAMEFTLAHDDGLGLHSLHDADVVIVGVSRTSKTPTTVYLANRGVKAANVPYVAGIALPVELEMLPKSVLVVGLTKDPRQLSSIRRTRLTMIDSLNKNSDYDDLQRVKEEVKEAKSYYQEKGWSMIDVSNRSIEETAAEIIKKLAIHQKSLDES